ncbi:MAG: sulfatase-like hydrolase/transferase, partial [Candidatus Latescibacteria bacterium]|nr:sulfatase-like hydrolase/transferase [Candidatus Latescibacterota bacterium]
IHTGRAPHTHGVRINGRPLPPKETTLAEVFLNAGYATVSISRLPEGQEQGFELINVGGDDGVDPLAWVMFDEAEYEGRDTAEGEVMPNIKGAIGWLRAHGKEKPFFMWMDNESIHEPWRPPPPYDTMYDPDYEGPDASINLMWSPDLPERQVRASHALCDGQISHVDDQLGLLFEELDRSGIADDTVIVVVSDHGTFMGEHDLWQKCPIMFDPVMRATLIIRPPEKVHGGAQVAHLAQLGDVFATVLDLAGVDSPEYIARESFSLQPTWRDNAPIRDNVMMEFCFYKGTASKAVRTEKWLYVYFRSSGDIPWGDGISPGEIIAAKGWKDRMLFDLVADPDLNNNVVDENPDVEREMRDLILDWLIDSENDLPYE